VSRQRVALTFDDGPGECTEPILDVLAAHSARATFFVIGSVARERADLIQRIHTEGHEIGNHTWSHPRLARDCDDGRVREELVRTNAVVDELVGRPPRRFRAPHYDVSDRVLAIASDLGLAHTHGDVTPPDWDMRCTARYITVFVVQQARPNAVIGLHDGVPPNTAHGRVQRATVQAVGEIVPRLLDRGFECVTASEILRPH
jgi:peptidoglycan/xylan/chitin deacetylase (PgdA/CDA1 family)